MPEVLEEPEVEVVEEDTKDQRFDDLLAGKEEEPVEEYVAAEETVEEVDEPEDPTPDLPMVEGPTPAMETVARQAGIPPKLVALARDDKQLQEMIALTEERREEPVQEEAPKFEISLPEDEYGSDNAVREQFVALRDHYEGILNGFREDMSSVVGAVRGIHDEHTESVKQDEAFVQRGFDDAMDAFESDVLGKAGESMGETQRGIRSTLYGPYQKILKANPALSKKDAAEKAAREGLPGLIDNNKAKQQRQSLQKQSRQRLGSGQSVPAPEIGPDRDERMDAFLSKLGK